MRTKTIRTSLTTLGVAGALALAWSASVSGALATQPAEETVVVGGQQLIRLDASVGRIAIGDDNVADFRVLESRREVLILGRRAGQTSLTIWDQQGAILREINLRVRPSSGTARQIIDELEQLIGGIEGIEYREVGGTVWLEGEVLTERDLERIGKVLESYPEVRSLVELSPLTAQMMDRAQADAIKTVQLDVTIMEVDRSKMRDLGVRWSSSISPQSSLPFEGTSIGPITGVIENLLPSIDMLASSGQARVLSRPTLITKSGQPAELFVGGEIPIPVAQGNGAISIEYKEYGVKIEFEPVVDSQDNVDTKILVETSNLGGPAPGGGAPGLITNRVSTGVFVRSGESITLGGLVKSEDAQSIDKVPGLGDIPVLGNLFKSKSYMRNETELVVFATPRVVSVAEAGRELRDKVTADFEEFEEIESFDRNKDKKKDPE
jgi:pilus assembly protein CpaC